jgi:hypothetical protein
MNPHAITDHTSRLHRVVWYDKLMNRTLYGVARLSQAAAKAVAKEMNELFGGDVICSIEPVTD